MAKKSILVFARIVNKTQKSTTKNELHDTRITFDYLMLNLDAWNLMLNLERSKRDVMIA